MKKLCRKCNKLKEHSLFNKQKENSDKYGLKSECKTCDKIRKKVWKAKKTPDEIRAMNKKHNNFYLYGLRPEDYEKMLINQEHKCAICCEIATLHIDHDHNTGRVRALLCQKCNVMLGMAQENIRIIKAAIVYLKKYE